MVLNATIRLLELSLGLLCAGKGLRHSKRHALRFITTTQHICKVNKTQLNVLVCLRSRHVYGFLNVSTPRMVKPKRRTNVVTFECYHHKHSVLTGNRGGCTESSGSFWRLLVLRAGPRVHSNPFSRGPWKKQWVGCFPSIPHLDALVHPAILHFALK